MTASPAYWINTAQREITEVSYDGLDDMRRMVDCHEDGIALGGFVGAADTGGRRSPIYVGDKGLYKPLGFFQLSIGGKASQPLRGNGLVTGPDSWSDDKATMPLTLSLDALRAMVRFLTYAEATAWVNDHANEAAISINGQVTQTWAQFWRDIPPGGPA